MCIKATEEYLQFSPFLELEKKRLDLGTLLKEVMNCCMHTKQNDFYPDNMNSSCFVIRTYHSGASGVDKSRNGYGHLFQFDVVKNEKFKNKWSHMLRTRKNGIVRAPSSHIGVEPPYAEMRLCGAEKRILGQRDKDLETCQKISLIC